MPKGPKGYGYSFTVAALVALTVGFALHADAGLLIFRDRDRWQSAVGGAGLQFNFNTFTANTSFAGSAYNFGPFTLATTLLETTEGPPSGANQVFADSDSGLVESLNGTPYASMFLDSTRSVVLDFSQPTLAFGADFVGGLINFGVFHPASRAAEIVPGPTADRQFFGIVSTDPISRIQFLYSGPQDAPDVTVRFDDVGIAAASSVPEPSSLMILGVGASLFAAYGCVMLRRPQVAVDTDQA